jgi:SAM-dependent methyltransferase
MRMDLGRTYRFVADLPVRVKRRLTGQGVDYREVLFRELADRLQGASPKRILEIGPRDGEDSRRLATLRPEKFVLVDLPNQEGRVRGWLPSLKCEAAELVVGNIMYDGQFDRLEPFDLIWCTGVLYHNPEQLRFVRKMFDLTAPGGILVLETATARRPRTRNENCVEIWYPPNKTEGRAYHVSTNVTHLPSAKAVHAWIQMIGYDEIQKSACHRAVGRGLAADRVAYIGRRPFGDVASVYYGHVGHDFPVGRAR